MTRTLTRLQHAPLVIVYERRDGNVQTDLNPRKDDSPATYGILIADLVRHAAKCFGVDEGDVWAAVEQERGRPTSPITDLTPRGVA